MAEMGTEPDPDFESEIWRITGSGFGVLVFGFGMNGMVYIECM